MIPPPHRRLHLLEAKNLAAQMPDRGRNPVSLMALTPARGKKPDSSEMRNLLAYHTHASMICARPGKKNLPAMDSVELQNHIYAELAIIFARLWYLLSYDIHVPIIPAPPRVHMPTSYGKFRAVTPTRVRYLRVAGAIRLPTCLQRQPSSIHSPRLLTSNFRNLTDCQTGIGARHVNIRAVRKIASRECANDKHAGIIAQRFARLTGISAKGGAGITRDLKS